MWRELVKCWYPQVYGPQRLLIEMPPRHGKSEMASHWFPVATLENFPDWRIILASYEADFAATWGRKVRDSIRENGDKLTVRLNPGSQAVSSWLTTKGGGMTTAGAGGPITGRGANILIADDPVKNAEEAASETYRNKIWDWWRSTAYTRLEPGASAIVVMTRWNEDDLGGRLIKQSIDDEEAEKWTVIKFPAIAEEQDILGRQIGDALWPERYPVDRLHKIKHSTGTRVWASLYQQRPAPQEGGMFVRDWFAFVDEDEFKNPVLPKFDRLVRYWDFAATEKSAKSSDPDWTVGTKLGYVKGMGFVVVDVVRLRDTPRNVEKKVKETALSDGVNVPIGMEQEPGSAGKTVISHFKNNVLPDFDVKGYAPSGDKVTRAIPFSAASERGDVKLARGRWNSDWLSEFETFPMGAHDDQVDSAVGAYTMIAGKPKAFDKEAMEAILRR